jgi:hypothetical protein
VLQNNAEVAIFNDVPLPQPAATLDDPSVEARSVLSDLFL